MTRFSGLAEVYAAYRPRYPEALVEMLERECGLSSASAVADVGSGTGISSELFLKRGCAVFAVEPNGDMRHAAEERYGNNRQFRSVAGRAEETGLKGGSVDFVFVGQAFHWFSEADCKQEFARILRTPGWLVLAWNVRRSEPGTFSAAYERFLQEKCPEYVDLHLNARVLSGAFTGIFDGAARTADFAFERKLTWEQLLGFYRSASYSNKSTAAEAGLEKLFADWQGGGAVGLDYQTRVYYGRLR